MKINSILNRYIFGQLFAPFIITLIFFTFVFLMAQMLKITNLWKTYSNGVQALADVSLEIQEDKPYYVSTIESVLLALRILEPETEGFPALLAAFDSMIDGSPRTRTSSSPTRNSRDLAMRSDHSQAGPILCKTSKGPSLVSSRSTLLLPSRSSVGLSRCSISLEVTRMGGTTAARDWMTTFLNFMGNAGQVCLPKV